MLKKSRWLIIILILLLVVPSVSLGRFFYTIILDHFYKTKNFYFNSDLLTDNNAEYTISNWSGVDTYVFTINMNSILNDKKKAESDITYEIAYECGRKIECNLNKNNGIIYSNDSESGNRDYFTLTVVPTETFLNNEETTIKIYTMSINPYKKKLGAVFTLKASKIGLSYEITDKESDIFSVLRLTNSLTYYTVKESFDKYNIGDEIDQIVYSSLTDENKKKCYSLVVDLSFDPKIVNMDLTNSYYLKELHSDGSRIRTTMLRKILIDFDGYKKGELIDEETYNKLGENEKNNISELYEYINGLTIDLDAISSAEIKFYKKDKFMNYTYPFITEESIITIR